MPAKKNTTDAEPTLDESLVELEALVATMESGELSLDDAMRQFERGIELTRRCQKALSEAEQKVDILMQKSGEEPTPEPFADDDT